MRNLISYNASFIWNNKLEDRNLCIGNFNKFYLEAKNQDKFYITENLQDNINSIFIDLAHYKPFDELKAKFPWLTVDTYNTLFTLLEIKTTKVVSNNVNDYNIDHTFSYSSWMGICSIPVSDYAYNIASWQEIHRNVVKSYNRQQRLDHKDYFKKFYLCELQISPGIITRDIKRGIYSNFVRLDVPNINNNVTVHNQLIHMHLKSGGALNIDGTWKHQGNRISRVTAEELVKIGFILPENL